MTSPAKFRKDKEIVAEYETQVKGPVTSHSNQMPCLHKHHLNSGPAVRSLFGLAHFHFLSLSPPMSLQHSDKCPDGYCWWDW
ncbi:SLIT-ROBO Rho GTPase-activating protein 2B [Liparis tanakae]|uniref:SLIT-ROBO Rho GTPase-activating protein 2B n=1 Tax=Liparis tanakae TaxID=230148 RepID=A0A4Z2HCE7_9TELE|nr:SLIT-ROBO Rho GTPase-activating protein 2B [Liparis tanakae]